MPDVSTARATYAAATERGPKFARKFATKLSTKLAGRLRGALPLAPAVWLAVTFAVTFAITFAVAFAAELVAVFPTEPKAHAQAVAPDVPGEPPAFSAIDGVPLKANGPVTVVTQFPFSNDDESLRRVWLAALATNAGATRTGQHLALVWEKQAERFGRWELRLVSDTGLVSGSSGQRLAVAFPKPGTTYTAALSYDPVDGVVTILVTGDGAVRVYNGELRVTPGAVPTDLYPWTGIECDAADGPASGPAPAPTDPNSSVAAATSGGCEASVSSPSLISVVEGYVPVGADARLVRPGRGGQGSSKRIDRRLDWAVRLEALRLPQAGTLRLVAHTDAEPGSAIVLAEVPAGELSSGGEIPFDARALPAGKAHLVVEYVERDTWELASLPVDVGVVSAKLDTESLTVDTARGVIAGSLVLEADGPIEGLTISLTGEMLFDEPTDDPPITAIRRVGIGPIPLRPTAPDTPTPETPAGRTETIPFTVPLPSTQIAGRLDLRLRAAAELPDGVSAQLDTDFRHVYLVPDVPSLAELFGPYFAIGFATDTIPREAEALLERHFNVVTTGNSLKWDSVQRRPGVFDFARPDALLEWASQRGIEMIGHTLVWHQQTPDWVFQGEGGNPPTRELLLARMKEHIHTVVGRYCGRIRGWDVVNEALEEDGSLRNSPWRRIIGDDYIEWAFRYAHEACPSAELYYNDYNLTSPAKRQGAIRLIRRLQEQGIPVYAVGEQGHYDIFGPSPAELQATIEDLASLGVKVMITELDMSAYAWADRRNVYTVGFPPELARRQALRYAEFFRIFIGYADVIDRVTFWGTTDRYSWKNDFPVPRRTDHPLLFDRDGHYKPAFWAVLEVGKAASGR